MTFCTAINCMDGRTQLPVIHYLRRKFDVLYVDSVTEPGPARVLADMADSDRARGIFFRVDISVKNHNSVGIALAAHYDCAGNPAEEAAKHRQINTALKLLHEKYPGLPLLGLWIDHNWQVHEVASLPTRQTRA